MWRNFTSNWRNIHLINLGRICTNWGYGSLKNPRRYWNSTIGRFIRKKLDLIITNWRQCPKSKSPKCTISFCEKWHFQKICSTSPRVDAHFGKSALMRIVRSKNNLAKDQEINGDKSAVICWRRMIGMEMYGNLLSFVTKVTRNCSDLTSTVILVMSSNEDLLDVDHRSHDNWVVFQDVERPKSILRKSTDMSKPIQRVKFTKLLHVIPKFQTKIPHSDILAQVNLISAAPTFQTWGSNSGGDKMASKVPAKLRGRWPKVY